MVEHRTLTPRVGGSSPPASAILEGSSAVEQSAVNAQVAGSNPAPSAKPKFDRNAYHKDYMKKYMPEYRARKKKAPQG